MFVFESREDVIHELTEGQAAHNCLGWECLTCGRIAVRAFTPRLTPLSCREYMRLPPGVQVDVEMLWRDFDARERPAPVCPVDGVPMALIEGPHTWI